jgi:enoyl-CoA hydratase
MYEQYRALKFNRQGPVLTVILDNPPVNAVNSQLHDELSRVFYDIERDDCRLVVLTGAGRAFSGGGDFADMLEECDHAAIGAASIARASYIVQSMLNLSVPVIARINGHAIGLGATLALLADVGIAADGAKIADPHVVAGLSAGDGGSLLWPLLIGFARARHYLLTGEALMAADAAAIGLIHKAVPSAQLDAEVASYAQKLLSLPPLALRATKRSINMLLRQFAVSLADAHAGLEHLTLASADHREAVLALKERRAPVLTGR